jgi:hypothetical protein
MCRKKREGAVDKYAENTAEGRIISNTAMNTLYRASLKK